VPGDEFERQTLYRVRDTLDGYVARATEETAERREWRAGADRLLKAIANELVAMPDRVAEAAVNAAPRTTVTIPLPRWLVWLVAGAQVLVILLVGAVFVVAVVR